MRILIVGGGVAGLTLAALLERRGVRPTVLERSRSPQGSGYMLGLYPLGSRVLHGLGQYEALAAQSAPMGFYQMANARGEVVHRYAMGFLDERYGPILQVERPVLMSVLRAGLSPDTVRYGVTVTSMVDRGAVVEVTLSDGTQQEYDLVVGADGIHSQIRELLFGELPYDEVGWGGWVWWADEGLVPENTVTEYWGPGSFLGVYPVKGRVGLFGGGPIASSDPDVAEGRRARLLARFAPLGEKADHLLSTLPSDDEELFYWAFSDIRAPHWSKGRVVLMGDAAVAFLPTAGVGASMAMESAAVLNDELSRADARRVPAAIDFFTKRRRERVEKAQDDSRQLADLMFVERKPVSKVRDFLMRFYSLKMLANDILESLDEPI